MGIEEGVVVGLDNGGTANNATVMTPSGEFLVDRLVEVPSRVTEGPDVAVNSLVEALDAVLALLEMDRSEVRAVGLDTPGPASADGVISSRGSTNFGHAGWRGFDVRTALEERLGIPVVYNNDGNAAALYAHYRHYGLEAPLRSSVSAIVGTGLGGGVIEAGSVVKGAAGMAGELGHVLLPSTGCWTMDSRAGVQLRPVEASSFRISDGIQRNLLPYWLARFPDHELNGVELGVAARRVRSYGERFDQWPWNLRAAGPCRRPAVQHCINFTDPHAYFVGGGVVGATWIPVWYLHRSGIGSCERSGTSGRDRSGLDMARPGSAIAALSALAPKL